MPGVTTHVAIGRGSVAKDLPDHSGTSPARSGF